MLCEKAFTLNLREAELVALAKEHDRFLMEAMWMYCNPLVRRLKGLVDDGVIGEVRTIQADFGINGPFPPSHRLRYLAQGGGALLDLGVYPVSFAQLFSPWVLGRHRESGALSDEGVDLQTGALPTWRAALSLRCTAPSTGAPPSPPPSPAPRAASTSRRTFFFPDRLVLHRDGRDPEEFTADPAHGPRTSLRHEAAEVMRALRAGEKESQLVPLDGSLAAMRTLDTIRTQIGVRYPGETD